MTNKMVLVVLVAVTFACRAASNPENALLGVWQIQTIENIPGDGSMNNSPLPSLAIFTRSHYSLVWMPGAKAMREFKQRWLPTDEEKIQRYGEIVVNSGTYTQTESTITARPVVSRVPEFMGGGRMLYSYHVDGHTLLLTSMDEYSYDGIQAPWAVAGDRVKLTLKKVAELD